MKWIVQELQQARFEPIHFNEMLKLENELQEHQDVRAAGPVHLIGSVSVNRNVFTFHFTLKGELTLACARTLADVKWPYEIKGIANFVPEGEKPPAQLAEEDVYTYSGDELHFTHVLQERIFVDIPIQVFADHPTNAQAPSSGKGWELVSENKTEKQVDPRLADLAKFFDEK